VWDDDPARRSLAAQQGWNASDSFSALLHLPGVGGVALMCDARDRADLVEQCLTAGKHVFTEPPIATSRDEAARLYDLAGERGLCCWSGSPRRWDNDVLAARRAIQSGRLGELRAIRFTSAEWAPWANLSDHRGDEQRTTWDVLAPVILDQLAELTTAHVVDTFVQPFQNEDGFLALITLKGGTVVQLDLRRRSLVGLQTGWMLEGDRG